MVLWTACSTAGVSQVTPYIGFVYPAGGVPGDSITVTIGGQHLKEFAGLHITGVAVEVGEASYLRIYDRQEANRVRRMKETAEARMAEEEDALRKQQIQRSLELIEQEAAMVAVMRREERMNPEMAKKKQFNPQISERITLTIKIPDDAPFGDCELRAITKDGLSNPIRFQIGQLPEIYEAEPNDSLNSPQKIASLPVLVNGQIMPGDVDTFRLRAAQGQTLVFKVHARSLIPYLADAVPGWFQAVLKLYDSKGNEVAYNDDYFFDPDPVLIYEVPEDGDYTLSIRDSIYRGREDFIYRISIGELPFIERIFPLGGPVDSEVELQLTGVNLPARTIKYKTGSQAPAVRQISVEKNGQVSNSRSFSVSPLPDQSEKEPNDSPAKAMTVSGPLFINGSIGRPGDQDWFRFSGKRGEHKTIEVLARRLGSPLDSRLTLYSEKMKVLAVNDDREDRSTGLLTHHADSRIDFTLPDNGTYWVCLEDVQARGGDEFAYRLLIGSQEPDFQLRVVPSSLRIPRQGAAIATVHAIRSGGFTGPIQLSFSEAPIGLELESAVIPEGVDSVQITLAASRDIPDQIVPIEIEGTARPVARAVRRRAGPSEDMMQAFLYRHLVSSEKLLVQVVEPDPVTVTLTLPREGVIRTRPGTQVRLSAKVTRTAEVKQAVRLLLSDPPEWLTLASGSIGGQGSSEVVLKISPNAEPGQSATVVLNGSVRITKSPQDPDFNPVMRAMNSKPVDFSIAALNIEIID